MRRKKFPVQIGKNLHKGVLAFRTKEGGYSMMIVWLKKDYESGEGFELADIDKIDTILHFCDKESVEQTIKVLKWMIKQGIRSAENGK